MKTCIRKAFLNQFIAFLLKISIALLLYAVNADSAGTEEFIYTENIQLSFKSECGTISQWIVSTDDSIDKNQWKSLLTRDPSGRLLSRHLSLNGIEMSDKSWSWSKSKEGNEIVIKGSADNGRLAIRKLVKTAINSRLVLEIEILNISDEVVELQNDVRLIIGPGLGEYPENGFGTAEKIYSFVEPVVSVGGKIIGTIKEYQTLASSSSPLHYEWYGIHSRYFALLLAPLGKYANSSEDINLRYQRSDYGTSLPDRYLPLLTINLNVKKLNPGQIIRREFLVFSGPKSTAALKGDGFDFSGLLFSGIGTWIAILCSGMLWVLKLINGSVSNWGLSIILFAIVVRIVMYPFTCKVSSSQKAFAEVQKLILPDIENIKKLYRGGEQSEKILELYKQHGVNPFAGLKPLMIVLAQLPIFIGLFHVLGRAFELRTASFLWIETLADPDRLFSFGANLPLLGQHFNVLPVFMAVTTILTIKISPSPSADKNSKKMQNIFMMVVAIGFFLLFYSFPSGMVLYWSMANTLHLLQRLISERV